MKILSKFSPGRHYAMDFYFAMINNDLFVTGYLCSLRTVLKNTCVQTARLPSVSLMRRPCWKSACYPLSMPSYSRAHNPSMRYVTAMGNVSLVANIRTTILVPSLQFITPQPLRATGYCRTPSGRAGGRQGRQALLTLSRP